MGTVYHSLFVFLCFRWIGGLSIHDCLLGANKLAEFAWTCRLKNLHLFWFFYADPSRRGPIPIFCDLSLAFFCLRVTNFLKFAVKQLTSFDTRQQVWFVHHPNTLGIAKWGEVVLLIRLQCMRASIKDFPRQCQHLGLPAISGWWTFACSPGLGRV